MQARHISNGIVAAGHDHVPQRHPMTVNRIAKVNQHNIIIVAQENMTIARSGQIDMMIVIGTAAGAAAAAEIRTQTGPKTNGSVSIAQVRYIVQLVSIKFNDLYIRILDDSADDDVKLPPPPPPRISKPSLTISKPAAIAKVCASMNSSMN